MGTAVWFRVDADGSPLNDDGDHSIMCRADKELDQICSKLGVEKLTKFFDSSELAAEYGEREIEKQWFDPELALATVEALLRHLAAHPEEVTFTQKSRLHWREQLVNELNQAKDFLTKAVAAGARFHFLLVP